MGRRLPGRCGRHSPRGRRKLGCDHARIEAVLRRSQPDEVLLESVWDYRFDPQTKVIDVHISRLRSKIDKDAAIPLIHTVRGVGYTLSPAGPAGEAAG